MPVLSTNHLPFKEGLGPNVINRWVFSPRARTSLASAGMAPRFMEKLAPRRRGGRVQPRFAGEGGGSRRVEIQIGAGPAAAPASRGNSAPTVPILLAPHPKAGDRATPAVSRDHRRHQPLQLAQASTDTIEEQLGGAQACSDDGRKRKIMGGLGGAVKRMMSNLCRKTIGPHPKMPRHQTDLPIIFEPVVEEAAAAATVEQDEEQSVSFFSLRLDAIFEEQLAKCVSLGRLEVGEELIVAAQNLVEAVRRTRGLTLNEMTSICPKNFPIQAPAVRRSSTIVCEPFLGGGELEEEGRVEVEVEVEEGGEKLEEDEGREKVEEDEGRVEEDEEEGRQDGREKEEAKEMANGYETGNGYETVDGYETADLSSSIGLPTDPPCTTSLESLHLGALLSDVAHPYRSAYQMDELKDSSEDSLCTSLVGPSSISPIASNTTAVAAAVTCSFSASSSSSRGSKVSVSVGERQRSPRLEQLIALFEGSSLALTM